MCYTYLIRKGNGIIVMNHLTVSDSVESPQSIIIDLVTRVLENRLDIKPNKSFIHDVASYTLEKSHAEKYIAESMIINKTSIDLREDYRLVRIIELLAIVNRAIDVISVQK
jgi:hypothetical protein